MNFLNIYYIYIHLYIKIHQNTTKIHETVKTGLSQ